ncbi:hypothetical protein SAMN05421869_110220 [Nonomuraea jiangxiensis]|uniref:Uncharacterized protein n=1 Tax=Nonomuraea jiangxiensis TaxID=633440 RepID=A0A1G8TLE7_9ACTN|nr:hypothetical protein SAMN05421869_110220 [Nonomuraea jiangxiensis]
MAREWLLDMPATPKEEFPGFPAALSHLLMLAPQEICDALERRVRTLEEALAAADLSGESGYDIRGTTFPGVALLEDEYLRVVVAAELQWLWSVVDDLRSGDLTWSAAISAEDSE